MNILLPNLAPLRVDHPPHFVEADNIGTKWAPTIVINGVMGPYKWPEMNGSFWGYFTPNYYKWNYFTLTYNCWRGPPCARHWQGNLLNKKTRSLKVKFKLDSHPLGASIAFSNLLFLKALWNWSRDIFSYIYHKISGKMNPESKWPLFWLEKTLIWRVVFAPKIEDKQTGSR